MPLTYGVWRVRDVPWLASQDPAETVRQAQRVLDLGFFSHAWVKEPLLWTGGLLLAIGAALGGGQRLTPGVRRGLWPLAAYLVVLAASWALSPWPHLGAPRVAQDAALAGLALVAAQAATNERIRTRLPVFLAAAFVPAALVFLWTQRGDVVLAPPAGNPNISANLFLVPLFVLGLEACSRRGAERVGLALAALALLAAVLRSRSEGAMIGLLGGAGVLAWVARPPWGRAAAPNADRALDATLASREATRPWLRRGTPETAERDPGTVVSEARGRQDPTLPDTGSVASDGARRRILVTALPAAALLAALLGSLALVSRVAESTDPVRIRHETTLGTRILFWESVVRALRDSPGRILLGFGPGTSPVALGLDPAPDLLANRHAGRGEVHPHSEILRAGIESGLLGLAALALAVFASVLRRPGAGPLEAGLQAGLAAALVHGAGCVALAEPANRAIVFLAIGALAGMRSTPSGRVAGPNAERALDASEARSRQDPTRSPLAGSTPAVALAAVLWLVLVPAAWIADRALHRGAAPGNPAARLADLRRAARAAGAGGSRAFAAHLKAGAVLQDRMSDPAGALEELREARRILPGYGDAALNEAKVLLDLGRPADALTVLAGHVRRKPCDATAWNLLGQAAVLSGADAAAMSRLASGLERAAALHRQGALLRFTLAQFLWQAGNREKAIAALEDAIRTAESRLAADPKDPEGLTVRREGSEMLGKWRSPPRKTIRSFPGGRSSRSMDPRMRHVRMRA